VPPFCWHYGRKRASRSLRGFASLREASLATVVSRKAAKTRKDAKTALVGNLYA
jgi:hypothetical protein